MSVIKNNVPSEKKSFFQKYGPSLKSAVPIRPFSQSKDVHPNDAAGLFSTITFSWLTSLVWKAFKKPPTADDLWQMSEYDATKRNYERMLRLWEEELRKKGPADASLWRVTLRFVRTRLIMSTILLLFYSLALFCGSSIIVQNLLAFISEENESVQMGIVLIAALFFVSIFRACVSTFHLSINYRTAVRTRAAILLLVFKKALKMSSSNGSTNVGELVTMCSNDGDRIFEANHMGNTVFIGPVIFVAGLIYTCHMLGPIGLVGPFVFILTIPLQGILLKIVNNNRKKMIKCTQARTVKINEILNAIKLIKMYSWEKSFSQVVTDLRDQELSKIKIQTFLYSLIVTLLFLAPLLASVVMISLYVILGHKLTPDIAFTSVAIFNAMSTGLKFLPTSIKYLADGNVALKRLKKFLVLSCLTEYVKPETSYESNAIEIENASFSWSSSLRFPDDADADLESLPAQHQEAEDLLDTSESVVEETKPVLKSIDLSVKKGSLVGIFGSVGCGKSSLMSGIMGQLELIDGTVAVSGSVAYTAQQAWLMNATIRENIVFGSDFDKKKYDDVVSACELTKDFEIIPSGDLTEVGERGINLSGGQKQRISLARALYSDRDVYLLDDPLSAVDTHVGKSIFFEVILSRLKNKGKTVLLVTHQLQYLPHCDQIVKIENLTTTNVDSENQCLISSDKSNSSDLAAEDNDKQTTSADTTAHKNTIQCEEDMAADGKLITSEESGDVVGRSTYYAYLKAGGGVLVGVAMLMFFIVNVGVQQFSYFWLSFWLNQGSGAVLQNVSENASTFMNTTSIAPTERSEDILLNPSLPVYIGVYLASILIMLVLGVFRAFAYVAFTARASRVLHESLFNRILHCSMAFFDTTPTGRIINRFQKDMDELDLQIPGVLDFVFLHIVSVFFTAGLIIYVYPTFALAFLVTFPIFVVIYILFKPASREMKRLDILTRSPWFVHMSTTISGLDTIRVYEKSKEFVDKFCSLLDRNGEANYLFKCVNRWLGIRLELLNVCITAITAAFVVFNRDLTAPSLAALALSSAYLLNGLLTLTVRLVTELEARFVCADRIKFYIENTDRESSKSSFVPDPQWPEKGAIEFRNVSMRYRDGLPFAIDDVSFSFEAGEKVGVVGRTGAGKSSLAVALFRLTELAGGSVIIDDVDVGDLSLHDLRSRLSIIPQDPVLFSGTVRYNLDPFDQYSDHNVWRALGQSHMKVAISKLPGQLESLVAENGNNFSVGERQLLCLARALLRKSKILILDEATAAVDHDTEEIVHKVIDDVFSQCTVVTIAHRLSSVTSCDRVLVLDKGQVVEFDAPSKLLENKESAFAAMISSFHSDIHS